MAVIPLTIWLASRWKCGRYWNVALNEDSLVFELWNRMSWMWTMAVLNEDSCIVWNLN